VNQPLPVEQAVLYTFELVDHPDLVWHVRDAAWTESLSAPYELHVSLVLDTDNLDPSPLFGADCRLTVQRGEAQRDVLGVVERVERARDGHARGSDGELLVTCELVIVPALALLRHRVDVRVFQDMTVTDILRVVLGSALDAYDRKLDMSQLARAYPAREYTVQYHESDLDFASRLMEREGIAYHFEHDGDRETLVLSDENRQYADLDAGPIPVLERVDSGSFGDHVSHFRNRTRLVPTRATLRGFDWTNPELAIEASTEGVSGDGREREIYGSDVAVGGYSGTQYGAHDATAQAQLSAEEHASFAIAAFGRGGVISFVPGRIVELENPTDPELGGRYLLVAIRHRSLAHPRGEYANEFECIPADVQFRPRRRTRAPRAQSVETAIVTGPSGEEIHTDEHGRIKVQFHWDRAGARDDRSSCWVRVAQNWAGAGWGFVFVPRVGMEVLVSFIDGDPDRPLVTGCVYNGTHPPPYALPGEKTKSTIKTSSSPGGAGWNELRFEDLAGSEEVYLRAQKDLNEEILDCHTTHVGVDQANLVDRHHTELVGANAALRVEGERDKFVAKSERSTVEGPRTERVVGDETISLESARSVTVGGEDSLRVAMGRTMNVGGSLSETVLGSHAQMITATQTVSAAAKNEDIRSSYAITAADRFQVSQGKVTLVLTADGARVEAAEGIVLESGKEIVLRSGKSSLILKKDGQIEIAGDEIVVRASKAANVSGAKSAISLEGSGIDVSGSKVEIKGDKQVKIKSSKINDN
jgi:type VI secretion system secreted protein VgrG